MKTSFKKIVVPVAVAMMLVSLLTAGAFAVKPTQTNQGCQTEGADYLVDIVWVEFGSAIYTWEFGDIVNLLTGMGLDPTAAADFAGFISVGGTLVGQFGPCCFDGGPRTYEGPRNNGFPNGCCKPPDFETFPFPGAVGGGDGNPCLCQSGLHPTPEGRTYGDIITLNGDQFVELGGELYILLPPPPFALEEWMAMPIP